MAWDSFPRSYAIAALLDVICVVKYANVSLKIFQSMIKPMLATVCMGGVIYVMIPHAASAEYSRLVTIAGILIGVVVYVFSAFLFGAITQEDTEHLPGGKQITSVMIRLGIWKADRSE